jgi:hypothetical protein
MLITIGRDPSPSVGLVILIETGAQKKICEVVGVRSKF